MFQFPAFPPVRLCIHLTVTGSSPAGFPHSDVCGSMPACGSPQLIAACHVLLRRMVPGHPPCALCSLILSSLILRPIVLFYLSPSGLCNWSFFLNFCLCSCQGAFRPLRPCIRFHGCVWVAVDSNHRPPAYQAGALTD